MSFNTDNTSPSQNTQPQQQSGRDQHQMQAGEADHTPHARSREDEMRDWQCGFAGS